ncbi:hypothetical protein GCM10011378_03550 [Hymenobacter glacieicola]|uniref:GH16 domain-containing protein n=1 Tax=Hymenobacter glacieicola TaxID=1562124 RepID=A0ABQ1WJ51_9BACT|nr:hypothetical protein GCM10011378_03550 [Hymenobacter glacieicola]
MVFEDDFRYPTVDSMLSKHTGKWSPEQIWGNAHWDSKAECQNYGPESYAYRPEDIRLVPNPTNTRDGMVALDFTYHPTPLRKITSAQGTVTEGEFYKTSGLLRALYTDDTSCGEPGFRYGIFEIRAKLPATDGLQAAFWLWGGYGVPNCEGSINPNWQTGDTWELDMFESFMGPPTPEGQPGKRTFFSSLQRNPYSGHESKVTHLSWLKNNPATSFHVYTLVWAPTEMVWLIDGQVIQRIQGEKAILPREMNLMISSHYQWDCKKNQHCPTAPDGVTATDQHCPSPNDSFLIDYIRVYRPNQAALGPQGQWPAFLRKQPKQSAFSFP